MKDETYKGLCEAINRAQAAYMTLDPDTAGAKDLVDDIAKLQQVKNAADKNRNDSVYQMAAARNDRTTRNLDAAVKMACLGVPLLIQTAWIVMAFIAEDGGKVLSSKTARDFVFKLLRVKP